jgi:hypothetical protein
MILLGLASVSPVRAVAPKLNSITPAGGQRGTDIDLKLAGVRLEDTQEIILYSPGVEVLKFDASKTNSVKAHLRIASDCRLGEHQLRVRTATGVSELRTFYVGAFKGIDEAEPNNEPAKAQKIPLNVTVAGSIGQEDTDCFVIEAKKGQRLSAEIEAMRLGRAAFDPYLAILESNGTVLTAADDTALLMQDAFVSILAPNDGRYIIQVRETSYGGNDNFVYRLHVGDFPRPTAVYPAGGKAGETLSAKFIGDPSGDFYQNVKLPDAAQEKFGAFAEQDGLLAPSPNWMRVSSFPNVMESSSNQDRQHATATDLTPPFALNGIIAQKGEVDWFRFPGKKGQALDVSVYARWLRSPLDSVLEVFDTKGASLAVNDDSAGADSMVKFTPAADGDYFVRIKDQLGEGRSDYVYRIEITPSQPSLALRIPTVNRNDTQSRQHIVVPRGNRFATVISAKRANFSGDLAFSMEGLPSGVTLQADVMRSSVDAMPLVFEAASDAPVGGKLLDLLARAVDSSIQVEGRFRNDIELVQGPNNSSYYGTRVDKLYVAVVDEAPFQLRLVEPKVPLVQAGSAKLSILAERRPGFDEAIQLKMVWNPPGVSASPEISIPKGQSSVDYPLNASGDAQPRTWKIAVLGSATVHGGPLYVSSQLVPLEISTPFIAGKIEALNVEPGQTAKLVCKLEQKAPFEGKATVKLMGLPEKITAPDVEITKESSEAVFPLTIDPKIALGSHKALFCSVDIRKDNESILHSIANRGVLRVVPPKKPSKTGDNEVVAKTEAKGK